MVLLMKHVVLIKLEVILMVLIAQNRLYARHVMNKAAILLILIINTL